MRKIFLIFVFLFLVRCSVIYINKSDNVTVDQMPVEVVEPIVIDTIKINNQKQRL
jgi:hypothetical protein